MCSYQFFCLPNGFLLNHNLQLDEWVICSIYENLSAIERENRKRKAIVLDEGVDTKGKKKEIVLQQGPLNGNQENNQSLVPLFDNLQEELIPNASDLGCDITPLSDTDLAKELKPNASDIGCNIAPLSDTDLADFTKLMEGSSFLHNLTTY